MPPWAASRSILRMVRRVETWSRRWPLIQASKPARARESGATFRAVRADERFEVGGGGMEDFDLDAVAFPHFFDQVVRFLRQAPAVDGDDADVRVDPPGHVEDGHAVGLEAGRQRQPVAIAPDRPAQQIGRRPLVVDRVQPVEIEVEIDLDWRQGAVARRSLEVNHDGTPIGAFAVAA
jgi:hypothetical protein